MDWRGMLRRRCVTGPVGLLSPALFAQRARIFSMMFISE
jgi:hypothetical protein